MNQVFEKFEKLSPVVFLLARVVIGYMFLLHGTAKFFEFPFSMTGGNGSVTLFSMYGVWGILEIGGGLLLELGILTSPISFFLACQKSYSYFFMHMTPQTVLDPLSNKGEIAIMYCMAFLLFLVKGAWSLKEDEKLANKYTAYLEFTNTDIIQFKKKTQKQ